MLHSIALHVYFCCYFNVFDQFCTRMKAFYSLAFLLLNPCTLNISKYKYTLKLRVNIYVSMYVHTQAQTYTGDKYYNLR